MTADSYFFRVLIVPAAVFLSVVFGASYGSGREVVQFVSLNGPTGGFVSILTLVTVYALLLMLSFEIARMFRAFEYVSFFKVLLHRGWFLYEIVILGGMIIALSITTTVGGTVLQDHFGIAVWVGSLLIFGFVVILNYYGRKIVEKSMMLAVAALYIVLAILAVQVFSGHFDRIVVAFGEQQHRTGGFRTGLKYAVSNGGYLPLLLYCVMGLKTRAEALTAGAVAAVVAVVPAVVFHVSFMVGYPAIVDERLPAYWLFQNVSTPLMLNVYVVVMFVLVAQTGVGLMQGLIQRIDNWQKQRRGKPMTRLGHGGVAAIMVATSLALGSMGIVALILRGYTIMFFSFIVVYIVPLFTYGIYLVIRGKQASD
jgi:uncharacterized membrane protein YkvI